MSGGSTLLVLGSGAREHVLTQGCSKSEHVRRVYVCPGNGGTACLSPAVVNVSSDVREGDQDSVVRFCKTNDISLVVVGPEAPLAAGIADCLRDNDLHCFGPSSAAARIESDKVFAKELMAKHNIPTASYKSFTNEKDAVEYINSMKKPGVVIKAAGLAAGKGVTVAATRTQALSAVQNILVDKHFGSAGNSIIIEELLAGVEVSCFCLTDGQTERFLPLAQDHKQLLEGNMGPNTGGMGAYTPCRLISANTERTIHSIMSRTLAAMRAEGCPFSGVLYGGFMVTDSGPKILEFNCRFGDPEAQVVLSLFEGDLYETLRACACGTLESLPLDWFRGGADQCYPLSADGSTTAVGLVLASGGYPTSYGKGYKITGLDAVASAGMTTVFHAGTKMGASGDLLTSGGRVLTLVSVGESAEVARRNVYEAAKTVHFKDVVYRRDIGHRALCGSVRGDTAGLTYAASGVNVEEGNRLVESLRPVAKATTQSTEKVTGEDGENIGMFGGIFDLKKLNMKDPILVSGTDGVGTKLKIAIECGKLETVGIDLVAMCVNDLLCHCAEPIYFLDYYACGKLDKAAALTVIKGIGKGCQMAGCQLIGGETAELPGLIEPGIFDIAGFAVGAVERSLSLPRKQSMAAGDVLIGVSSSGIHSNGFSLVRKVVELCGLSYSNTCPFSADGTLGDALLTPTEIYTASLLPALKSGYIKGMAHITGGGLVENIPRVLPPELSARLDALSWPMPAVFSWIKLMGAVTSDDMSSTFNCGIGAVLVVDPAHVHTLCKLMSDSSVKYHTVGELVNNRDKRVEIKNLDLAFSSSCQRLGLTNVVGPQKKRVAILISGTGTNMLALVAGAHALSPYEVVLVLSNKGDAQGLHRAAEKGIPTRFVDHRGFPDRSSFDMSVDAILEQFSVDIVCLAGFMRILSDEFVIKWRGRMINVHPSLLPSFKGMDARKQALEAGVTVTGCTVHFVEPEVDSGAIILQRSLPVLPGDTDDKLADRMKAEEHKVYPEALVLLSSGRVRLDGTGKLVRA